MYVAFSSTGLILFNVLTAAPSSVRPQAFTTDFRVHWAQHPLRPEFAESTYFLYKVVYQTTALMLCFRFPCTRGKYLLPCITFVIFSTSSSKEIIFPKTAQLVQLPHLIYWLFPTCFFPFPPGHRRPLLPGGRTHHPGQPQPLCSGSLRFRCYEGCAHWEPRRPVSPNRLTFFFAMTINWIEVVTIFRYNFYMYDYTYQGLFMISNCGYCAASKL